jgi:PAS domain S-box-containing protein
VDALTRYPDLDPDRRQALAREADVAVARRSLVGGLATSVTCVVFGLFLRGDATYSRAATVLGGLATATIVMRVLLHRHMPTPETPATVWRRWAWLRGAMTTLNLGAFSLHNFVALWRFGLQPETLLMLTAQASVLAGVTYAQSPRPRLMYVLQVMLVGAPLAAVLVRDDESRALMAVMLLIEFGYASLLGRRLSEEYWEGSVLRARLEATGAALAQLERQTRELVERTPDAMGIVRDGVVVFVNAAWTSLLGAAPAGLIGTRLEDLAHPQHRAALRSLLAGARGDTLAQEVAMRRADGSYATWEVSPAEPLRDEGETARLVVARDVTERNRLRAQLLLAERMSSVGTLAAGVAHEVNNPLSYVLMSVGQARAGLRQGGAVEELDEILREAEQGAERVRAIVRDLRTFSRVDDAETTPVDLNAALDFAVKMTANEVRHRARFERDNAADPPAGGGQRGPPRAGVREPPGERRAGHPRGRGGGERRARAGVDPLPGRGDRRGQRHRRRHPRRGHGPHLRPLLHHEGRGRRHGPGALHLSRQRALLRRRDHRAERPQRRRDLSSAPARRAVDGGRARPRVPRALPRAARPRGSSWSTTSPRCCAPSRGSSGTSVRSRRRPTARRPWDASKPSASTRCSATS